MSTTKQTKPQPARMGYALALATTLALTATACNRDNPLYEKLPRRPYTLEPGGPAVLEDPEAWTVDVEDLVHIEPIALVEDSLRTQVPREDLGLDPTRTSGQAKWIVEVEVPAFGLTLPEVTMEVFAWAADAEGRRARTMALYDVESDVEVVAEFPLDAPPTGTIRVGKGWSADW